MRTTDDLPLRSGHPHPNPLASHAPTHVQVNGMAPADVPALQQPPQRHGASSPRPGTSATNASAIRASVDDQTPVAHAASNGTLSARPGLLRARSDFGPRHLPPPTESADEGSVDGHFKIRHGWDDQLNSEEYSNLLTSVRGALESEVVCTGLTS
jgi:regulator-associated protein of mTOR